MYQISNYSGKIKNTETGDFFMPNDSDERWILFLQNNENLHPVDFFDGEEEEKNSKEALKAETELYVKRSKDGRVAYAEISAEFRLGKLNGTISEETHSAVERALIPVRNEVLAGQWISAKNELILLGSSVIGQQLYDRLLNQITNYISENY